MGYVTDILIGVAGFVGFALFHSIMANLRVKKWIFDRWQGIEPYYRFTYSVLSVIILGVWYLYFPFPEGMIYTIEWPWSVGMRIMQALSLILLIVALKTVNLMRFVGIRQVAAGSAKQAESEPLVKSGIYSYVRHPLYTATIALLAFNPVMSAKLALITVLVIAYCWIGSIFEEKNLVKLYGEEYIEYQKSVPRFVPKPDF